MKFVFSAIDNYRKSKNEEFKNIHLLDVGCGKGAITLPISVLGCQVTAFDIDEESIAYLEAWVVKNKINNLKIFVEDGYALKDTGSYDIIIASEVFEHVRNPSTLAHNISKLMHGKSCLIVTIPNGYGP